MAVTTNYTTYDQAYYYADVKRLPRLSEAQRQHLVTTLPVTENPTALKQQLIESYLPFATSLAIALCPRSRAHRDLPDLIGEANLTVVEVIGHRDLSQVDNLTSYLAAWIRGRVKRAKSTASSMTAPHNGLTSEMEDATSFATHDHVLSLDALMVRDEANDLYEPHVMPLTPTEGTPPRDPRLCAQVEQWLSYLSPRAQTVLRLHYGLAEDNERQHSLSEIAHLLGVNRRVVFNIERDALIRLRALAEGKATLGRRNGKACICYPAAFNTYAITPEQEVAMKTAYHDLQTQGMVVSGCALARAAAVSEGRARMFLRLHQTETSKETRERQRVRKLEEASARLEAQGVPLTVPRLVQEARVGKRAAREFLAQRKGTSHVTA